MTVEDLTVHPVLVCRRPAGSCGFRLFFPVSIISRDEILVRTKKRKGGRIRKNYLQWDRFLTQMSELSGLYAQIFYSKMETGK